MATNPYDYIIIGTGQGDLTPTPSTLTGTHPKRRGESLLQKQSHRFVNEGLLPDCDFQFFDFTEMRVS